MITSNNNIPFLSALSLTSWPLIGQDWSRDRNTGLWLVSDDILQVSPLPQSVSMGLPVWASAATSGRSKAEENISCITGRRKLGNFVTKLSFKSSYACCKDKKIQNLKCLHFKYLKEPFHFLLFLNNICNKIYFQEKNSNPNVTNSVTSCTDTLTLTKSPEKIKDPKVSRVSLIHFNTSVFYAFRAQTRTRSQE